MTTTTTHTEASTDTYWWDRPYETAQLTPVPYTPTADAWDRAHPRYFVRYNGWSCHHHLYLETREVPEREIAERQADILRTHPHRDDWHFEVVDMGRASHEEFGARAHFWALDGRRRGQRGFIAIRHRDTAFVTWCDEPAHNPIPYPLTSMSLTPPPPPAPLGGSTWLRPVRH